MDRSHTHTGTIHILSRKWVSEAAWLTVFYSYREHIMFGWDTKTGSLTSSTSMWPLSIAQRRSPVGCSVEFPLPVQVKGIIEKKKNVVVLQVFLSVGKLPPSPLCFPGMGGLKLNGSWWGWMGNGTQPIKLEILFWGRLAAFILLLNNCSFFKMLRSSWVARLE